MTSILITAVVALMIPSTAFAGFPPPSETGIGEIKDPPGLFTPVPSGIGRAVAYDGVTTLFYTFVGDSNIYMVDTDGVTSLGPIPISNRAGFTCGALDFDGTNLFCGTYDGFPTSFYSINPTTGFATLLFTEAAFGGFSGGPCFGVTGFVDGLAKDTDGSFWVSDDGASTLWHLNPDGSPIAPFAVPSRTGSAFAGCNSGITIAGNFLELVLIAFEADGDGQSHEIIKVSKEDPTTVIVRFPTGFTACCEGLSFDANTFIPRAVVWANDVDNVIKAYDVQITRTIGFWKNHSDLAEGLPISLGDGSDDGVCQIVDDATEVKAVMKDHKGKDIIPKLKAQLLAAKLNVELGDIPPDDLAAITIVIADADALLSSNTCEPILSKFSALLGEARTLHSALDAFNNLYSP